MAYQIQIIAAGTNANADLTSSAHEIETHLSGGNICNVQINGTSLSHADGVLTVEQSNDGTNWSDVIDGTITMASGTTSQNLVMNNVASKYIRVDWAKGSNASGTYGVTLNFK